MLIRNSERRIRHRPATVGTSASDIDRRDHHGGEHRRRKVVGEPGSNDDQDRHAGRADEPGQLRPRPALLRDRRARRAARDREPAEQTATHVGRARRSHLPVLVDHLVLFGGEGAGQHARVGERHERDAGCGGEQREDVAPVQAVERRGRQSGGERTDDRDLVEVAEPQDQRCSDDGDEQGREAG